MTSKPTSPSEPSDNKETPPPPREDLFRQWFLYTVASGLTLVSLLFVHDEDAAADSWFFFSRGLVLLLILIGVWATWSSLYGYDADGDSSSWFPQHGTLLSAAKVLVVPCWWTVLVVIIRRMSDLSHSRDDIDDGGLAVATSLVFTWAALAISLDTLLRDWISLIWSNNHAGSGDERTMLWAKLFVAVLGHGFFSFYRTPNDGLLFLLARFITCVLSCWTLAWMALAFVPCHTNSKAKFLPSSLVLAWCGYACFTLIFLSVGGGGATSNSDDHNVILIMLTPLVSLGATAYYAVCLADFLAAMQLWKDHRKIRFIRWAVFAWACVMSIVSLMMMLPHDNSAVDEDHPNQHPESFVWVASCAMQLFLWIHAVAALHFYWQHEKATIILENRLVRTSNVKK
eukprot:scaffold5771_cov171-Amphora_coffeaeformis.AAC.32